MMSSMMLGRLHVRCMELEKRMSKVLMMLVIVFCDSETWPGCVASNPWGIRFTYHKGKLSSLDMASNRPCNNESRN